MLALPLLLQVSSLADWSNFWYDPLNPFAFLYQDRIENVAQCARPCPVGFGCVVSVNASNDCARCPPNTVSPFNGSNCMSCSFDTLTWRRIIKNFLEPTADKSHCTMAWNEPVTLYNTLVFFGWYCILGFFILLGAYFIALCLFKDSSLHRAMRFHEWDRARDLFVAILRKRGAAHAHARITKEGYDGKTPLQLVLARPPLASQDSPDGAAEVLPTTPGSPLLAGSERVSFEVERYSDLYIQEEQSASSNVACDRCNLRLLKSRSMQLCGRAKIATVEQEKVRKELANAMFQTNIISAPSSENGTTFDCSRRLIAADDAEARACCRGAFASVLPMLVFPLAGIYCGGMAGWAIGSVTGVSIDLYYAEEGGAVPQPATAGWTVPALAYWFPYIPTTDPPSAWIGMQDNRLCGMYCEILITLIVCFFGIPFGALAGIAAAVKFSAVLKELIASARGPHELTLSFFIIVVLFNGCLGGFLSVYIAPAVSSAMAVPLAIAAWSGTAFVIMTVLGDCPARCCLRSQDNMLKILGQVLASKRTKCCAIKSSTFEDIEVVFPIVAACLRSTGSLSWGKVCPPGSEQFVIDRAVLVARRIAFMNRPLRDGNNVLHSLIEAHAASIIDTAGCVACIKAVASSGAESLVKYARNKTNRTVAQLAMATAKDRSIKEAVLVVLYDRYAITALSARLYESSTCRVYRAEDLETGNIVAIKLYAEEDHFTKEFEVRKLMLDTKIDDDHQEVKIHLLDEAVVNMLESFNHSELAATSPRTRARTRTGSASQSHRDRELDELMTTFGKGAIVLTLAQFDLHTRLSLTRTAGIDVQACKSILHDAAAALNKFHTFQANPADKVGLVHGDVKPRNVVFLDTNGRGSWQLIDLDASHKTGAVIDTSLPGFKWTSGFASPELARACHAKERIAADPKMDVFSFGVLAYELCAGQRLFPQDTCNNNIVGAEEMQKLCLWLDVSDPTLSTVFVDPDCFATATERSEAQHLIRACLQGDPTKRPTMEALLSFAFLKSAVTCGGSPVESRGGGGVPSPPQLIRRLQSTARDHQLTTIPISAMDNRTELPYVISRSPLRSRYHIFISHMQREASGDVGTLFFLFEQMGVHGWRDMNQIDLTEIGMRQGVYDSDVFILFLTNSYLSRPFCLLELTWALEFGKPIIIVQENDPRFWPFDLERWQKNLCHRAQGGGWVEGDLKTTYEDCPARVREFIESHVTQVGLTLPFRRRDFEVNALTREILRRASEHHTVVWGSHDGTHLPPPAALSSLQEGARRRIFVFGQSKDIAMINEFKASVEDAAPRTVWSESVASATHAVMLLSKGSVNAGTPSAALLEEAAQVAKKSTGFIHFLYIDESWSFDEFYELHASKPSAATRGVASHECMKFPARNPQLMRYEHDALIFEMLGRMRMASGRASDTAHDDALAATK